MEISQYSPIYLVPNKSELYLTDQTGCQCVALGKTMLNFLVYNRTMPTCLPPKNHQSHRNHLKVRGDLDGILAVPYLYLFTLPQSKELGHPFCMDDLIQYNWYNPASCPLQQQACRIFPVVPGRCSVLFRPECGHSIRKMVPCLN